MLKLATFKYKQIQVLRKAPNMKDTNQNKQTKETLRKWQICKKQKKNFKEIYQNAQRDKR